uniref:Uncharacterized protein n=1 Tax=Caenorhabditis japonica TaxID=281687 RepID=A0A8R1IEJ5_CAEJA
MGRDEENKEALSSYRMSIETSPEVDITEIDEDGQVYEEYYVEIEESGQEPNASRHPYVARRSRKIDRIVAGVSSEHIDVMDLGRTVILGTSDGSLNSIRVEKAVKSGGSSTCFLGNCSMEALVNGLMTPYGTDARYAMIGNAIMWNALKSDMRDVKSHIVVRSSQALPKFEGIDLDDENLDELRGHHIRAVGVFGDADLGYIFNLLTFRSSAKLLNKAKQFLKAYFIVACRPRCMIWRYTLRRTGMHKKAILNLPVSVVKSLLNFLLDLTGIGCKQRPFREVNRSAPFYQLLGSDDETREETYTEMCHMRDSLKNFFREAITDVLNEIREMPFCSKTGTIVSPLRGRHLDRYSVMWKDYEAMLKAEHDNPSERNTKIRVQFEQHLCEIVPH